MVITIVTVGTKPKPDFAQFIADYEKRLPRHIRIVWRFLKHGSGDPSHSVEEESESILSAIAANDSVILLDETGEIYTSEQFSRAVYEQGKNITFVIGGAYGVSQQVFDRADRSLSFGRMVFPHQLMRLMLVEQIYRGYCISSAHPYHHS